MPVEENIDNIRKYLACYPFDPFPEEEEGDVASKKEKIAAADVPSTNLKSGNEKMKAQTMKSLLEDHQQEKATVPPVGYKKIKVSIARSLYEDPQQESATEIPKSKAISTNSHYSQQPHDTLNLSGQSEASLCHPPKVLCDATMKKASLPNHTQKVSSIMTSDESAYNMPVKSYAAEKEPSSETAPKKPRVDYNDVLPTEPYLCATVVPILVKALIVLAIERPADPIQYLADFLIRNKARYSQPPELPETSSS